MKFIIEYNNFEEVEVSRAQTREEIISLDGGDFFKRFEFSPNRQNKFKKIEKSTGDYIVKKFKEIDKNNDYVIRMPQDSIGIKNIRIKSIFFTFGGTRVSEFDSIIQEIEDEYFMVTISFGLTRPHHFMCDQVDGLMAFLKSIYDILEKFRIGRRIDKRLKLESNQSSEWYEKLPNNDIKFFKRYKQIHFLPKEIQDLKEFSRIRGFSTETDLYDYLLTFRKFKFSDIKIEVVKFEDEWYRALISGGGKFEWYRCDSLGGLKYFLNEKMSNFDKIFESNQDSYFFKETEFYRILDKDREDLVEYEIEKITDTLSGFWGRFVGKSAIDWYIYSPSFENKRYVYRIYIEKEKDEYFRVSYSVDLEVTNKYTGSYKTGSGSGKNYKCDQLDGLIACLNYIKSEIIKLPF